MGNLHQPCCTSDAYVTNTKIYLGHFQITHSITYNVISIHQAFWLLGAISLGNVNPFVLKPFRSDSEGHFNVQLLIVSVFNHIHFDISHTFYTCDTAYSILIGLFNEPCIEDKDRNGLLGIIFH